MNDIEQAKKQSINIDQMIVGCLIAKHAGTRIGLDIISPAVIRNLSDTARSLRVLTKNESCIYMSIATKCLQHLNIDVTDDKLMSLASLIEDVLMKGE